MNRWTKDHSIIGKRAQLHPATDAWMQGDRYGAIVEVRRNMADPVHPKINGARIKMDRSGRILTIHADNFQTF